MADEQITIYLNTHKYKALEATLANDGKDIQSEIQARLDLLYEQTVPPEMRAGIDESIAAEDAERRREIEEGRRYIAVGVKENCTANYIESPNTLDFLQAAMAIRRYQKGEPHYDVSSFKKLFFDNSDNSGKEITAEDFLKHIETGPTKNLLAVYYVDFDEQTFSALDKNTGWLSYSMRDVTTAAYHAFRKQYRSMKERHDIFAGRLEGKEIKYEQESGQSQGMSM